MARHPRAGAQRGRRWAHHGEESALSLCLPAACGAPGVCEHKAIRQEQRQCELTGTRHPRSNSGTASQFVSRLCVFLFYCDGDMAPQSAVTEEVVVNFNT